MLSKDALNGRPVARWRRHDAAGAKHWFANESGNRIGPFARDPRLKLSHAMGGEFSFALCCVTAAEIIRRLGVEHLRQGQVELFVKKLQPRQRPSHQPRAVIAAPARYDLLLFRPPQNIVHVPGKLDVGFIGIRAAKAEVDPGHLRRRAVEDHFGKRDRRLGPVADVGVIICQFPGLIGDRLGDFAAPIADINTVEPGKGIQQAVSVTVLDMAA